MGLSGAKKRTKLSHDPNNTAWSKNADTFGHRILSSQGWTPGSYLGAENAAHSDHYTAANASHIRVLLREDNLGLGAKTGGKANAETFGLSTLSGIFGRLNGKTEVEVQETQGRLRDAELRTWQAQKFGYMNFVSGGLLVGDKIEDVKAQWEARGVEAEKRKSDDGEAQTTGVEDVKAQNEKAKQDGSASDGAELQTSKKRKRSEATDKKDAPQEASDSSSASEADEAAMKSRRKAEKKARREEKEKRRAERAAKKSGQTTSSDDDKAHEKEAKRLRKDERRKRKEQKRLGKSKGDVQSATPTVCSAPTSGVSTPTLAFGGSRHMVRQRYIQQKRMASMDAKAMNEILMIKAVPA